MVRKAAATGLGGLGMTVASTFAPGLGFSVHEQRVGFAVGIVLVLIAGGILAHDQFRNRRGPVTGGGRIIADGVERQLKVLLAGDFSCSFTTLVFTNVGDSRVMGMAATVELFDRTRRRVDRSHGRWRARKWADVKSPAQFEIGETPQSIDMSPDGTQYRLDVLAGIVRHPGGLMKQTEPNRWHGVYLVRQPKQLTLFRPPVRPGQYRLVVKLRGRDVPSASFRYRLRVPFPDGRDNDEHDPELTREEGWFRVART